MSLPLLLIFGDFTKKTLYVSLFVSFSGVRYGFVSFDKGGLTKGVRQECLVVALMRTHSLFS